MPRTFTRQELLNYNGQNGNPSYVAYKGKVYDVSSIFVNGEHAGVKAGKNLTNTLVQSPHNESIFLRFTRVGVFKD